MPKRNQKDDHVADRGVPVPEVRPRHDVGALSRPRRGQGLHGHDEHPRRRHPPRGRSWRCRSRPRVADGTRTEYPCDHVISSMPISQLLERDGVRRPPRPPWHAADDLRYRDFLTVALVVPEEYSFPDNWIYVHSNDVQVGRIQNFGSWSPYLVKEGRTCLGSRVLRLRGRRDVDQVRRGAHRAGQARARHPRPGRAVEGRGRLRRAHAQGVPVLRRALQGQRGAHRRVAARTARPTCIRSAATACTGTTTRTTRCTRPCSPPRTSLTGRSHDVWSVNVEEEYHEEASSDDDADRRHPRHRPRCTRDRPSSLWRRSSRQQSHDDAMTSAVGT